MGREGRWATAGGPRGENVTAAGARCDTEGELTPHAAVTVEEVAEGVVQAEVEDSLLGRRHGVGARHASRLERAPTELRRRRRGRGLRGRTVGKVGRRTGGAVGDEGASPRGRVAEEGWRGAASVAVADGAGEAGGEVSTRVRGHGRVGGNGGEETARVEAVATREVSPGGGDGGGGVNAGGWATRRAHGARAPRRIVAIGKGATTEADGAGGSVAVREDRLGGVTEGGGAPAERATHIGGGDGPAGAKVEAWERRRRKTGKAGG